MIMFCMQICNWKIWRLSCVCLNYQFFQLSLIRYQTLSTNETSYFHRSNFVILSRGKKSRPEDYLQKEQLHANHKQVSKFFLVKILFQNSADSPKYLALEAQYTSFRKIQTHSPIIQQINSFHPDNDPGY